MQRRVRSGQSAKLGQFMDMHNMFPGYAGNRFIAFAPFVVGAIPTKAAFICAHG